MAHVSRFCFGVMGSNGNRDEKEADFIVLPAAASDSWRTWLMTGLRRPPFDRRRLRGPHKGLKKMLIEGTTNAADRPQPWNDFSSAMVRQAVDEAMNALPSGHKQAVKLAYFAGLTNEEIAQRMGVQESAVRRWLKEALATVSAHVERGQAAGRKVIYALAAWAVGRWIADFVRRSHVPAIDHVAQAAVVVTAGVLTAAVLGGHSPSPAQLTSVDAGRAAVAAPADSGAVAVPKPPVESIPAVLALPEPASLSEKVSSLPLKLPPIVTAPSISLPKLPNLKP
jgi:RNA polymerase sigma factor (sigma-70 family)